MIVFTTILTDRNPASSQPLMNSPCAKHVIRTQENWLNLFVCKGRNGASCPITCGSGGGLCAPYSWLWLQVLFQGKSTSSVSQQGSKLIGCSGVSKNATSFGLLWRLPKHLTNRSNTQDAWTMEAGMHTWQVGPFLGLLVLGYCRSFQNIWLTDPIHRMREPASEPALQASLFTVTW